MEENKMRITMPLPDTRRLTLGGKTVPRGWMTDSDRDGYPNPIDCQPHNPKKQGGISWIIAKATGQTHDQVEEQRKMKRLGIVPYGEKEMPRNIPPSIVQEPQAKKETFITKVNQGLTNLGERYRSYKAKEPERMQARLEKVQYQAQLERSKLSLQKERLGLMEQKIALQEKRTSLQNRRQKAMGAMPSMFGSMGMGMSSPMSIKGKNIAAPSIVTPNPFNLGFGQIKAAPAKRHHHKAKHYKKHKHRSKQKGKIITLRLA
jgi:hypothetical protein